MLFSTIANFLQILIDSFSTISAHPNHNFHRYRMSLKQILYDKNLMLEINATHWEINLIFFMNIWTADIIDVGFINLVHNYIYFFLKATKTSSDTAHWPEVAWVFSFFVKGHWYFFLLNHGWEFELLVINVLDFSGITFLFVYPPGSWRLLCWALFMVLYESWCPIYWT